MNFLVLLVTLCFSYIHGAQQSSHKIPGGNTGLASGSSYSYGSGYTVSATPIVPILSYNNNPNKGDGTYSYSYLTGNAIAAHESGLVFNHKSGTAAQGSYSYTGPDGQQYTVTYTADANGFVPRGDHLPTPPPIPEAILKSVVYNAINHQSKGANVNAGSFSNHVSLTAPGTKEEAPYTS